MQNKLVGLHNRLDMGGEEEDSMNDYLSDSGLCPYIAVLVIHSPEKDQGLVEIILGLILDMLWYL